MNMPYDDKDMRFNTVIHKYVLTHEGVESRLFLDEDILNEFRNYTNFEQFLEEVSEDIYRYILMHKFIWDRNKWLEEIHNNDIYRPYIKNALLYQLRYAVRSGGNLLKDMHGIDLERARFVDIDRIRSAGIAPASIEELKSGGLLNTQPLRKY